MQLRLMTYNIKSGRYHPDGLEAVARVIEAQSPDVVGLQEVDEGMARTHRVAQADWLTRRLRMRGVYAPATEHDGGLYGIALLSRWPIQTHERQRLFKSVYADAASRPRHDSEQRVMLGAVVTPTPNPSPACPVGSNIWVAQGRGVKIIVTHLGLTSDQRVSQVHELADFARAWQGDLPTIIMGDFNCDPEAPELAPLRERFQEACTVCGVQGDARFTFPSGPLGARMSDGWRGAIDYIWASRDVQVLSARVLMDETKASDHQPLIVELTTDG